METFDKVHGIPYDSAIVTITVIEEGAP